MIISDKSDKPPNNSSMVSRGATNESRDFHLCHKKTEHLSGGVKSCQLIAGGSE